MQMENDLGLSKKQSSEKSLSPNNKRFVEEILRPSNNRFVIFPIKYHAIWDMYRKAQSAFWTAQEIDFHQDLTDWKNLTDNEQYFIKNILAFFSSADGIVNENLVGRFSEEVQIPEARSFYAFQIAIESIHGETYSLMIDTFVKDPQEKNRLFNAMDTIPCIKKKTDWAQKWISDETTDFATRLIAFAIIEGIFFSGAFCSIYWLKERGVMPGLTFSNELISRDESLHTEFAVLLYSHLERRIPQEKIHEIMKEAVDIETTFITESLPCALLGMNSGLMIEYIQFVTDRLIVQLGYEKLFNAKNPFDFMDRIGISQSSNFFESKSCRIF